jgi:hypothetical protein
MHKPGYATIVTSLIVVLGGCATSEEWRTWKAHPTHFSSGDHLYFSIRNREGSSRTTVTRQDIAAAQAQGWWGRAVTVSQEQIVER